MPKNYKIRQPAEKNLPVRPTNGGLGPLRGAEREVVLAIRGRSTQRSKSPISAVPPRNGLARGASAVQAADHDMGPTAVLAPAGILEVLQNQLHIVFGTSRDTSDFVADALQLWWTNRQAAYPNVRRLLIDLDNGPEINSSRTQFMKRMVEFADQHQLTLELAYYLA